MFASVSAFEARYQLRNPVLWVSFGIFFLLTFGAVTVDQIQIGDTSNIKQNSPFAIVQTVFIMSIFALFAVTAFVANSVTRDDETGFGPILRATPLKKAAYLYGRFAGAYLAAALGFLAVPAAILIGCAMPWLDPETLGPTNLGDYAYAYFIIALPTLLVFAAMLFALATATRSMMGAYLGLIAILVGWVVSGILLNQPGLEKIAAMIDPSGFAALAEQMEYWTAADRNTRLPELTGGFLINRAIWLGFAIVCLALAYVLYRPDVKSAKAPRPEKVKGGKAVAASRLAPARIDLKASFTAATARRQLWARTVFDVKAVVKSPAFFILLVIGLFNASGALWFADEFGNTSIEPVTRLMVGALQGSFGIIPVIIAAYYAGDLVWRDRERRMHEIIDAAPVADWAFVLPKVLAIFLVLVSTALVGAVAGIAVQAIKGYTNFELGGYLLWWVIPMTISAAQLAVLSVFFQTISANKFIGWGLVVVYLISTLTLSNLGFQHNLYQFGGSPGVPLSAFNGMAHFWIARSWFDLYWGFFCIILVIAAYGLWRRGAETRIMPRLRRFPRRMAGATGAVLALSFAAFASVGGWIFYNTNVLNNYQSSLDAERQQADMEKALAQFEGVPGPTISHVSLNVDLRPKSRMATTEGSYVIENRTDAPLARMLVVWPRDVRVEAFDPGAARVEQAWPEFKSELWAFENPLQPGENRTIRFKTVYGRPGFSNDTGQLRVIGNGTFIDNFDLSPVLGVSQSFWLTDRTKRRKYGLDPEQRPAKLEDDSANGKHYLRPDSEWVTSDITVHTDDDQIPIAPGYQVAEEKADGRIMRRFETEAPIQHFFSIQSARYDLRTASVETPSGPVKLEIYHHPAHTQNLERIETAMKASVRIFSERFSPFQFRQMRILEFPGYATFAQAFANTVPFSEDIGWLQANRDPDKVDLVTFVTAHEIAHQWWAHQLIGADKQGATLLSESFAQYSAMLVMEDLMGPEQVRQFLKVELDAYLAARGGEVVEELPLVRVENQGYIHYNKGALVMYFLRNEIGEAAVNRSLQRLLAQYAFKLAPYPSSSDYVRILREEAGPQHQDLITDLFERITLYDAKTVQATRKHLPDGRWEVTLTIEAKKLYADGQGKEVEADLNEPFEIGVFTRKPESREFSRSDVLAFERRDLKTGTQTVTLVLPDGPEPAFAGIDPYVKRIDRNSDDNVIVVKSADGT
ncbi:M1 family aminopeptidase [Hyphomonas sp.]|jgi:aminopeptidase N|uniref:M1 family aminopeptidase n=1 Tax=Hyphomonas sp. TaxID=87 RepID=UPI0037C161CC